LIYLLGSIILTSYLTLSFKVLERYGIPVLQAIVFNYLVCVGMGSVVNGSFPIGGRTVEEPWFVWALLQGSTFILVFNVIAFVTQKIGISIASVANKMSLVIPFVFSLYYFGEQAGWVKITGVVVALAAVVLTCWPQRIPSNDLEERKEEIPGSKRLSIAWVFLLPAIIFVGSGFLDTLLKYVEQTYLNEENNDEYLITCFAVAAVAGLLMLAFLLVTGKQKFDRRALLAGLAIGIPNYFSIWCLVKVLKQYHGESSAILPINNMGIVLFSSVMAWLLFRERLSFTNRMGIALSLAAILLISFG
jgi:drug/metabolite transporter (DMT)-like permease